MGAVQLSQNLVWRSLLLLLVAISDFHHYPRPDSGTTDVSELGSLKPQSLQELSSQLQKEPEPLLGSRSPNYGGLLVVRAPPCAICGILGDWRASSLLGPAILRPSVFSPGSLRELAPLPRSGEDVHRHHLRARLGAQQIPRTRVLCTGQGRRAPWL